MGALEKQNALPRRRTSVKRHTKKLVIVAFYAEKTTPTGIYDCRLTALETRATLRGVPSFFAPGLA